MKNQNSKSIRPENCLSLNQSLDIFTIEIAEQYYEWLKDDLKVLADTFWLMLYYEKTQIFKKNHILWGPSMK